MTAGGSSTVSWSVLNPLINVGPSQEKESHSGNGVLSSEGEVGLQLPRHCEARRRRLTRRYERETSTEITKLSF